jgi:ribonuclease HIII
MVCSYNLGKYINLNKIVVTLNVENIEYEPEQFPGLVYRIKDPKIVVLIFSSGKIILTGGKNLEDVKKGLEVNCISRCTRWMRNLVQLCVKSNSDKTQKMGKYPLIARFFKTP